MRNQNSVLTQTFHSPSVLRQETPVKVFGSTNLSFRKNKPKKNLKFPHSGLLQGNLPIFGRTQLETTIQFGLKIFIVPKCHKMKLLKLVFSTTKLLFRKNKPIKLEIYTFRPVPMKFTNFLGGWRESRIQFWPRLFRATHCYKMKLKVFSSTNLSLRKNEPIKL